MLNKIAIIEERIEELESNGLPIGDRQSIIEGKREEIQELLAKKAYFLDKIETLAATIACSAQNLVADFSIFPNIIVAPGTAILDASASYSKDNTG
ncbi:MAG: hypothetical protein HC896_09390 [Bacteroidales bacterium]|nr:hypothetical protein [Bacteroidales bacterium]